MSKQQSTIWPILPHTQAKHKILAAYLGAWVSIVGQRFSRAIFIDGFCGPGAYTGGEPGSPIVVIQEAIKALDARQSGMQNNFKLELYFIDEDSNRIANLKTILSHTALHQRIIVQGRFSKIS